jgi:hypothetical protein
MWRSFPQRMRVVSVGASDEGRRYWLGVILRGAREGGFDGWEDRL